MPNLEQSLNGTAVGFLERHTMNFRNRYLVIAIRILLGLIMLASGISGLLMGNSTQGVPEANGGLYAGLLGFRHLPDGQGY
jgi:hypothetical protein